MIFQEKIRLSALALLFVLVSLKSTPLAAEQTAPASTPPSARSAANPNATRASAEKPAIEWVKIPGGAFTMGSGTGDEAPAHRVTVKPFEMAKTMVTNRQYQACVDAGVCTPHSNHGQRFNGDNQPVVGVTWEQAKKFSQWIGGRLPSEAEWEYAARSAGKDWKYPWGDAEPTCDQAVVRGCGHTSTLPVCSKPAGLTRQGLCDMAGNAWEWVEDWYHPSYTGAPEDGSAWESPPGSHPVGRGGAWDYFPRNARVTHRFNRGPVGRFNCVIGFRPAR